MLKVCKYCGRIHDRQFDCGKKPKRFRRKNDSEAIKFRRTEQWTDKSIKIRERDNYMCQCCIRGIGGEERSLNFDGTQVHHIVPVVEDYERRLDDENLITLCDRHHKQAEKGIINRETLVMIVKNQSKKAREGPPGGLIG